MMRVSWICLVFASVVALQVSAMPSADEDIQDTGKIDSYMRAAENLQHQARKSGSSSMSLSKSIPDSSSGSDSKSGKSSDSDENIAPQLAEIVEYLYSWCRKKVADLTLTKIEGGYYYFYTGKIASWHDAREWCASHGMKLADLETKAESDAVIAKAKQLLASTITTAGGEAIFWIGGNALNAAKIFKWLTGTPFDYTDWTAVPASPVVNFCVALDKLASGVIGWTNFLCAKTDGHFVCEVANPCNDIFKLVKNLKESSSESESGSSNSFSDTIIHRNEPIVV